MPIAAFLLKDNSFEKRLYSSALMDRGYCIIPYNGKSAILDSENNIFFNPDIDLIDALNGCFKYSFARTGKSSQKKKYGLLNANNLLSILSKGVKKETSAGNLHLWSFPDIYNSNKDIFITAPYYNRIMVIKTRHKNQNEFEFSQYKLIFKRDESYFILQKRGIISYLNTSGELIFPFSCEIESCSKCLIRVGNYEFHLTFDALKTFIDKYKRAKTGSFSTLETDEMYNYLKSLSRYELKEKFHYNNIKHWATIIKYLNNSIIKDLIKRRVPRKIWNSICLEITEIKSEIREVDYKNAVREVSDLFAGMDIIRKNDKSAYLRIRNEVFLLPSKEIKYFLITMESFFDLFTKSTLRQTHRDIFQYLSSIKEFSLDMHVGLVRDIFWDNYFVYALKYLNIPPLTEFIYNHVSRMARNIIMDYSNSFKFLDKSRLEENIIELNRIVKSGFYIHQTDYTTNIREAEFNNVKNELERIILDPGSDIKKITGKALFIDLLIALSFFNNDTIKEKFLEPLDEKQSNDLKELLERLYPPTMELATLALGNIIGVN